jgi:uncharacterized protein YndB with AHSA1/START domain
MTSSNASIRQLVRIQSSPEKIYSAITTQEGLSSWWTPKVTARPKVDSIASFHFGPSYAKEMKIVKLTPNKEISWKCTSATEEWLDTDLHFFLRPYENGTELFFEHNNWRDFTEMFSQCSFDWAMFLRSLKLYCETGKGKPYPDYV